MRRKRTSNPWAALGKSAARSAKQVQRAMTRTVTDAVVRAVAGQTAAATRSAQRVLTGVATPAPAPSTRGSGRWETGSWGLGGLAQRRFRVFIPAGVTASRPAPLLVLLHGCAQDASSFAACTGAAAFGRAQRCIVLMPEQSSQANTQRCWNWFRAPARVAAEATLIMAIVEHVSRAHPVRAHQTAIFGLSAGGAMALTLALRFPDRFVMAGSHSGAPPHSAINTTQATRVMRGHGAAGGGSGYPHGTLEALRLQLAGRAPPPLLLVHGDVDHVVSFTTASDTAALWMSLSTARGDAAGLLQKPPRSVQRGQRRVHRLYDWSDARGPYVRLVRIEGMGHAWSGGKARQAFADPTGPDALRLLSAFAQARGIDGFGGSRRAPARRR